VYAAINAQLEGLNSSVLHWYVGGAHARRFLYVYIYICIYMYIYIYIYIYIVVGVVVIVVELVLILVVIAFVVRGKTGRRGANQAPRRYAN